MQDVAGLASWRKPDFLLRDRRQKVVVLFNPQHAKIAHNLAEPRMTPLQILHRHHAGDGRDVGVTKIDAALLACEATRLKAASDVFIRVGVRRRRVVTTKLLLIEGETDRIHARALANSRSEDRRIVAKPKTGRNGAFQVFLEHGRDPISALGL